MQDYVYLSIIFVVSVVALVVAMLLISLIYKGWQRLRNRSTRKKSFSELMR